MHHLGLPLTIYTTPIPILTYYIYYTHILYYTILCIGIEEIKLYEIQIQELSQQLTHNSDLLKQKKTIYDTIRIDRNIQNSKLLTLQYDINKLKLNFQEYNYNVIQLKKEILNKDNLLIKEHFQHHNIIKDKELLKNELIKVIYYV